MGLKRQFRMPLAYNSLFEFHHSYAIKAMSLLMLMNKCIFFRNRADYYQIYFLSEITLREIITY